VIGADQSLDGIPGINQRHCRTRRKTMKAIFDSAGAIFGVSATVDAAIIDANEWLEEPVKSADNLGKYHDFQNGGNGYTLFVSECSQEMVDLVLKDGGNVAWEFNEDHIMVPAM